MIDNTFKFYLKKDENTFLYVGPSGIQETTEKKELFQSVDDWSKATIALKRSPSYWAAFREFSVPQKFVKDARKILSHYFLIKGFAARCILLVEKLNPSTRTYTTWYEGDIDISQGIDDELYFQTNIKERGLPALLNNRESVPQEIPLDDPDAILMSLGGTKIGSRANWLFGDTNLTLDSPVIWHQNSQVNVELVPIAYGVDTNQIASFIKQGDQLPGPNNIILQFNPASNYNTSKAYLFASLYDLKNVVVSGSFRIGIAGDTEVPGPYTIRVKLWYGRPNQEPASAFTQFDLGVGTLNAPGFINIPLNASFDMPKDRVAFVTFNIISFPPGVSFTDELFLPQNESTISVSYQSSVPATTCKGFRYIDLFKKIVSKMTDGQYEAESEFLSQVNNNPTFRQANFDNIPYNTIATSGNGVRGLSNAVIKASLSDLYKDAWSRWALALSIEGDKVRLEPLSYFFKSNVVLHINSVNKLKVTVWKDKIFNLIKVGYGNYDNNNIVGKNEFNTGISFLVKDNDIIKLEDDLISPFRSDIYGIESARAETFAEQERDNRSDNDTFLTEVAPSPVAGIYQPYRPTGIITGVDDPTGVYNIPLSPKRALLRHLPRIRSFIKTGILQFQKTDKNPELVSDIGSGTIAETADVNLENDYVFPGNTNAVFPIISQYLIEFECSPPYNLIEILSMQKDGCISFDYNGGTFKGFILDVGCTPATNDVYTFRLISHPDNDLTKLRN